MTPPEMLFKALADSTRRQIMQLLTRQEMAVSELVACLRQPQSTVSRHLKTLRDTGLIEDRRQANAVHYSAATFADHPDNGCDLRPQLLDWIARQPVDRAMQRRIEAVNRGRQQLTNRFFSELGRRWDRLRRDAFGPSFHLEALSALLPPDWTVADIGTGTGYLLPVLSRCFRKVIAVDPSQTMLDVARARCQSDALANVTLRTGDLSRLPIRDRAVDVAIAALVLHHVDDPPAAVDELYRIIAPAGRLLLVEQRLHGFDAFHEKMQDRWRGFDTTRLGRLLRRAGFEHVRVLPLTAESAPSVEAPELFAMTAVRPTKAARSRPKSEQPKQKSNKPTGTRTKPRRSRK